MGLTGLPLYENNLQPEDMTMPDEELSNTATNALWKQTELKSMNELALEALDRFDQENQVMSFCDAVVIQEALMRGRIDRIEGQVTHTVFSNKLRQGVPLTPGDIECIRSELTNLRTCAINDHEQCLPCDYRAVQPAFRSFGSDGISLQQFLGQEAKRVNAMNPGAEDCGCDA